MGFAGQYYAYYTAKLAGEYTLSVKRGNEDLLMVYDNEVVQGPVGVNTPPLVVYPGASTGATTVVQHPYVFGSDVASMGASLKVERACTGLVRSTAAAMECFAASSIVAPFCNLWMRS